MDSHQSAITRAGCPFNTPLELAGRPAGGPTTIDTNRRSLPAQTSSQVRHNLQPASRSGILARLIFFARAPLVSVRSNFPTGASCANRSNASPLILRQASGNLTFVELPSGRRPPKRREMEMEKEELAAARAQRKCFEIELQRYSRRRRRRRRQQKYLCNSYFSRYTHEGISFASRYKLE